MRPPASQPKERTREQSLPAWNYFSSGKRLSAREECELARRAQAGDAQAKERMLDANIALVFSIARRYGSPRMETEDLVQEGMIGLCTAIERFEGERNLRFSTYATYWIRQRILRALDRQASLIHVPVDVHYAAKRAETVREQLTTELRREPTMAEVAERCGVSEDRLLAVLACGEEPLSLDASLAEEDAPFLEVADLETPDPERRVLQAEEWSELRSALDELSGRDRMVLEARFGLNGREVPLSDLAEKLRVSREAVRQIQRRALLRLQRRWLERMPQAA